jgi:hypothetical protein
MNEKRRTKALTLRRAQLIVERLEREDNWLLARYFWTYYTYALTNWKKTLLTLFVVLYILSFLVMFTSPQEAKDKVFSTMDRPGQ